MIFMAVVRWMAKEALKVLVRLLPPEITEDELLATIPEPHLEHTKWRSFQPGRRYKGEAKASVNSRRSTPKRSSS